MQIKKSINIFGKTHKIKKVKNLRNNDHLMGYFDSSKLEIVLDADLKEEELVKTLLHEILHAIWYRTGINQSRISLDTHEIIVENFSQGLYEIFNLRMK